MERCLYRYKLQVGNKALARRVIEEVWEKKNPDLASETHADNVSCHG